MDLETLVSLNIIVNLCCVALLLPKRKKEQDEIERVDNIRDEYQECWDGDPINSDKRIKTIG